MNKSNNIFRYVYIFMLTIVALSLVLIVPIIPGVRIHDIFAVSVSMKRIIFIIVASLIGVTLLFVSRKNEGYDNNTGKKRRESGIELLRIICMCMIILHHCVIHGQIIINTVGTPNYYKSLIFLPGGKIFFVTFMAISMWFYVDQQFRGSRFARMWLEVFFYSVSLTAVSYFMGGEISKIDFASSFLPIIGNSHGFAASFLLFYLLLPFMQLLMNKLDKRGARWLLILAFYAQIFSQIVGYLDGNPQPIFSEIGIFIFCFILIYNLKKWPVKLTGNKFIMWVIVVLVWLFVIIQNVVFRIPGTDKINVLFNAVLGQGESSIVYVAGGIAMFFAVKDVHIPYNKVINKLASYTFGILLIHDHHFFRNFVWTTYIKNGLWYQSNHLILRIVISGVLIFFVCSVVDYYRQNLLEKNIVRTKIFGKISNKLDRMCEFGK